VAEIVLVNPNYPEIGERKAYPSLREAPGSIDMAVLGVSNERLEAAMRDAIAAGVKAVTIFASGYLEDDPAPKLTQRIAAMAREAGMPICGGNCMGFYNLSYGLRVCGFPPPPWMRKGGAVLITHSGSVYSGICHNDKRMGWALAVSAGQELTTTVADYLDFALEMPETRCVGLFLETVRDPANFVAGLEKAQERDIPVIALKVGKTAASAAKAVSHSGAIAGNHAAYAALFDRHNVIEVETLDDFANALRLYSGPRRLAPGDIATLHDSGGLLELTIDLAERRGVSFAAISDQTKRKLRARLDAGLARHRGDARRQLWLRIVVEIAGGEDGQCLHARRDRVVHGGFQPLVGDAEHRHVDRPGCFAQAGIGLAFADLRIVRIDQHDLRPRLAESGRDDHAVADRPFLGRSAHQCHALRHQQRREPMCLERGGRCRRQPDDVGHGA
jgi:succinyl-CoA synthetase alpha subunit